MSKPETLTIDDVKYIREDSVNQTPVFIPKDAILTPFYAGKKYFIRTVTYHAIGLLKEIKGEFLVFSKAAWVADSGEFTKFLAKGDINEVEIMPGEWFVNIKSIADAGEWLHEIPTKRK